MFLCLDCGSFPCCLWRSELSDFIKNIFICVPKLNKGLTGLKRHGWVINDRIFIFGWTIPLTNIHANLIRSQALLLNSSSWNMYLYLCVSHLIQCFLHSPCLFLSIQLNWFSGWRLSTFKRGVSARNTSRPPLRVLLTGIALPGLAHEYYYVPWRSPSCPMIGWKANKLSNKRISSAEVLWILSRSGHSRNVTRERKINIHGISSRILGFVHLRPALLSLKFEPHTYDPKGRRRVFELGIYMYNLME